MSCGDPDPAAIRTTYGAGQRAQYDLGVADARAGAPPADGPPPYRAGYESVAQADDLDLSTLDPGIRDTVRRLRDAGFHTTDSGDGVTKLSGPDAMECAIAVPNVVIVCDEWDLRKEARRLMGFLADAGIAIVPLQPDGSGVSIQASYDPADGSAVIMLTGLSDGMWAP